MPNFFFPTSKGSLMAGIVTKRIDFQGAGGDLLLKFRAPRKGVPFHAVGMKTVGKTVERIPQIENVN